MIGIAEGRPDNITVTHRVLVSSPEETLSKVCEWLNQQDYQTLGIACFGPLGLNPESPEYGSILPTPKPEWSNFPVLA